MFTPLAKLAIGLSATMATAFYYLAAAPPASAQVCGSGNFSGACSRSSSQSSSTTQPPRVIRNPVPVVPIVVSPSPAPIADPVQQVPVVESPAPIEDPVQQVPIVESPSPAPIADPVQQVPVVESPPIADPVPPPEVARPEDWQNIYSTPTPVKAPTAIPEPGTVVALLVTGAGILCSGRKRNKQVRQQR